MEYLEQSLRTLFIDMHLSGLWPDGKEIADAVMLRPAEEIRHAYDEATAEAAETGVPVDLRAFHARYFRPVRAADSDYRTDPDHGPREHIEALWPHLTRAPDDPEIRSTRVPMRHAYVVVGGRFQEAYYWDSYFTQLGLIRSGRLDLVKAMLDNFAEAIAALGFVPNGFRSYYLTRSQPPFFAAMVEDYGRATGDLPGVLVQYLPALEAEYRFFTSGGRAVEGLSRYWDDADGPRIEMFATDLEWAEHAERRPGFFRDLRAACESGWDFSSRWLEDPQDLGTIRTTEIWPVDLNCLVHRLEEVLAAANAAAGNESRAAALVEAAEARARAIRDDFFDAQRGAFFDRLIAESRPSPVLSAATVFPLYAGIATEEQAQRTAAVLEAHLLAPGGLMTTGIESGQQWDCPNGWAPLNWIAVRGLERYGLTGLAHEIRDRWLASCEAVFAATGKFVEKYDVRAPHRPSGGGEYALQDGFGWTNGVYLDLLESRERQEGPYSGADRGRVASSGSEIRG